MAAPVKVPIAHNVVMVDEKLQGGGTVSVAAVLAEYKTSLIAGWLTRTKRTPELNCLQLSDEQRSGHLPKLVDDIVVRLGKLNVPTKDSDASVCPAAIEHGKLRRNKATRPPC